MNASKVQDLFRRAMRDDDSAAMRQGLELMFGIADGRGLSAEDEYQLRHPDYVMEMPQSRERIRGRDGMRAMQEAFPTPPTLTLRRVVGAGPVWVVEGVNDYDGDVWHVVVILELDADALIMRDTRYYARPLEPAGWRAQWVEPTT